MADWPADNIVGIPLLTPPYHNLVQEEYRGMKGIIYKEARLLIHLFTAPEECIREFLPRELSPGSLGMMVALVAEYPYSTLGPYKEAALFVECQYGETAGLHTAYMYIDQLHGDHTLGADKALVAGREILGFPKMLANIDLITEGNHCTGTVRRRGMEIIRLEAEMTGPGEFPDLGTMINVRAFPSPDMETYSYRDICTTNLVYQPQVTSVGEGQALFPTSTEDIRKVQVGENMATFFTVTDFCIPTGKTLAVL
ncbi:MAG: acetoacetate decarboxylase family protein [Bacillota bacterium]